MTTLTLSPVRPRTALDRPASRFGLGARRPSTAVARPQATMPLLDALLTDAPLPVTFLAEIPLIRPNGEVVHVAPRGDGVHFARDPEQREPEGFAQTWAHARRLVADGYRPDGPWRVRTASGGLLQVDPATLRIAVRLFTAVDPATLPVPGRIVRRATRAGHPAEASPTTAAAVVATPADLADLAARVDRAEAAKRALRAAHLELDAAQAAVDVWWITQPTVPTARAACLAAGR